MKKLALLFFVVVSISSLSAQQAKISLNSEKNSFELKTSAPEKIVFKHNLSSLEIKDAENQGDEYVELQGANFYKKFGSGEPNLPAFSKLIEIPQGAEVEIRTYNVKERIVSLNDHGISKMIIPAQQSVSKSNNEQFLIEKDEQIYQNNSYFKNELVLFEESGTMRHTRLGRIEINPFQYNPVSNVLKIVESVEVEILLKKANYEKTHALKEKYATPYFASTMGQIVNYNDKELVTDMPVTMVVVSDPMFETQLQPFVDWKKLKGFHVIEAYTDEIGVTNQEIRGYLMDLYQNPPVDINPPTFVLFVGDVQQIPAWQDSLVSYDHKTDLYYCEYTGDKLPEVYYGRFSAQNEAQLQPQIDKTLEYEKYLMPDPSYLQNHVLVSGVDAGYAPTFGNGAINYAQDYYCNSENAIIPYSYLYNDDESSTVMPSNYSGASISIRSYISNGVAWANYTAHCSSNGWGDPSFNKAHIASLDNAHKYGIWIGNCCSSVTFDEDECFGEAALRAVDEGAIGDIGGSNSTYWDEDYWWGVGLGEISANPVYENMGLGVYDGAFHTKSNEAGNPGSWYIAQGQINTCGNLAVEASTSGMKTYYWEIYHLMGDPSLMPFLYVPNEINVSHSQVLMIGTAELNVAAEPGATVAFSQDGALIAVAMADLSSGIATLNFDAGDVSVGSADIVVTGQNMQPYMGSIEVIPSDQPYVLLESFELSGAPDNGTTIYITPSLRNFAEEGSGFDAENIIATISSEDPYVNILDNTEDIGSIVAGSSTSIESAFEIEIADNVPDQHAIEFEMQISGTDKENYTWISNFEINANAPLISIGEMEVAHDENDNGRIDPNESGEVVFHTMNIGHAIAQNPIANLESSLAELSISNPTINVDPIEPGTEALVVFNVAAGDVEEGTIANLTYSVTEYETKSITKELVIGSSSAPQMVIKPKQELVVYPNPAKDLLKFESAERIDEIKLMDMVGKYIRTVYPNDTDYTLNLNSMPEGNYIIQVITVEKTTTRKIQVIR